MLASKITLNLIRLPDTTRNCGPKESIPGNEAHEDYVYFLSPFMQDHLVNSRSKGGERTTLATRNKPVSFPSCPRFRAILRGSAYFCYTPEGDSFLCLECLWSFRVLEPAFDKLCFFFKAYLPFSPRPASTVWRVIVATKFFLK